MRVYRAQNAVQQTNGYETRTLWRFCHFLCNLGPPAEKKKCRGTFSACKVIQIGANFELDWLCHLSRSMYKSESDGVALWESPSLELLVLQRERSKTPPSILWKNRTLNERVHKSRTGLTYDMAIRIRPCPDCQIKAPLDLAKITSRPSERHSEVMLQRWRGCCTEKMARLGIEPRTLQTYTRCSNHWAIRPLPANQLIYW